MSNYDIHITNILLLKWMKPHSLLHYTFFFGANFSHLKTPKQSSLTHIKDFVKKKALKSPDIKGFFLKKILKVPYLDNRFSAGHQIF
jgi:hypothetical protein